MGEVGSSGFHETEMTYCVCHMQDTESIVVQLDLEGGDVSMVGHILLIGSGGDDYDGEAGRQGEMELMVCIRWYWCRC